MTASKASIAIDGALSAANSMYDDVKELVKHVEGSINVYATMDATMREG